MSATPWRLRESVAFGAMCPLHLDAEFSSARTVFTRAAGPGLLIHRGAGPEGSLRGDLLGDDEWTGLVAAEEVLQFTQPVAVDRPVVTWVFRSSSPDSPWWQSQVAELARRGALVHSEERPAEHALVCLVDPREIGDFREAGASQTHDAALAAFADQNSAEALRLARRAFCQAPKLCERDVALLALAYREVGRGEDSDGVLGMARRTEGEAFHARVLGEYDRLFAQIHQPAVVAAVAAAPPLDPPAVRQRPSRRDDIVGELSQRLFAGSAVPQPDEDARLNLEERQIRDQVRHELFAAGSGGADRPDEDTPLGLEGRQIRDHVRNELFGASPSSSRYEIKRKLGAGGMGVVYEAYDPLLDCRVAIKQIHAAHADHAQLLERLRREARALARLRGQTNVVALFDYFVQDDVVFVVMEHVDGPTLHQWQSEPRAWSAILDMYLQAGQGLHAAHAAGIVHRDFKPENVLINAQGAAKVADFGLANEPHTAESGDPAYRVEPRLTATRHAIGTLRYMSPEQLSGAPPAPASDQYSFCVALYEALYGQHPTWPNSQTRDSEAPTSPAGMQPQPITHHPLARAILRGELQPPPRGGPGAAVPGTVLKALLRGLARPPEQRHASMQALMLALRDRPWRRRIFSGLGATIPVAAFTAWMFAPTQADYVDAARDEITSALRLDQENSPDAASPARAALATGLEDLAERWATIAGQQRFAARTVESETRRKCLDLVRSRFVGFSSLLARSQSQLDAAGAATALTDLPNPEDCVTLPEPYLRCHVDEAKARVRPEAQPAVAAMRQAEHYEFAGDFEAAIAEADRAARRLAAIEQDEQIGLLRARAHLLHGRLLQLAKRPAEALASLQAADDAVEHRECLDLRADVVSRLVKVTAQNHGLPLEPAKVWVHTQENLASKIPPPGGALRVAQAHNDKGLLWMMRGENYDAALAEFKQARDLRAEVLDGRSSPDQADTLRNLAIAYRHTGDLNRAGEALDAAEQQDTEVYGPAHPILYRDLYERGHLLLEDGDPKGALELFQHSEALAQRFGSKSGPMANVALAQALALRQLDRKGDAEKAVSAALTATENAHVDSGLRFEIKALSLALALERDNSHENIAQLERLVDEAQATPQIRAAALLNLAEALWGREQYAAAERRFTQVMEILGDPSHPRHLEALLRRGAVRYYANNLPGAIDDLEAGLARLPRDAEWFRRVEAEAELALSLHEQQPEGDHTLVCSLHRKVEDGFRKLSKLEAQKLQEFLVDLRRICGGRN